MKGIKKIITACLLMIGSLAAQPADRAAHDTGAEEFKTLYNAKKFEAIYGQLSPAFQSAVKLPEFTGFLEQSLYAPMGAITDLEFLSETQHLYSYIVHFKQGSLRMEMAMNVQGQIEGLQFLPYSPVIRNKILDYASDNKKQSGLDLLVDSVVKSYLQSPQNCGLSIGMYSNGTTQFYNYGETRRNNKQLPDPQTIYEIGSLTKTFCGLLLAQAILEKKIKPDQDIRHYLPGNYPELHFHKAPILVRHLANHTSGLPRIPEDLLSQPGFDSLNPYQHYSKQRVFTYLKTVKPSQEPGSLCEYSNLGMALLGMILEDIYQQPFETLVKEKICRPNQMISTTIRLPGEQLARFAQGYNQDGQATPHWDLGDFAAAGGLRSSTEDMLRYLNYHLAEKDEAAKLSHQVTFSGRETVGLAWFIKKTRQGNTLVWHNGGTYGFSGFNGFIKEKNCSLIILSNSASNADHIGIAILNYLQQ